MLPPNLEEIVGRIGFREPAAARVRLEALAADPSELLTLERLAPELSAALEECPDPDGVLVNLDRFVHAVFSPRQLFQTFSARPAALEAFLYVVAASQYLADVLVRNPEYFELLTNPAVLQEAKTPADLAGEIRAACAPFRPPSAQLDAVRRFRRREILRIGAADLRGLLTLEQTVEALSHLADAVVEETLNIVSHGHTAAGLPAGGLPASGLPASGLIVLGLGKLGGRELNYSSDIDLIFLAVDVAKGDETKIDAAAEQARALTQALSEVTAEGFLYRVDLLLRPYGASGALVVSAKRFEQYMKDEVHPAERQAMLKARVVAGERAAGERLLKKIEPLLFADEATARRQVRELKERIEGFLRGKGQEAGHVKLAPGGIRDIEFLLQALQLEYGSRTPKIVTGNTLEGLRQLRRAGLISGEESERLREAYIFLRGTEHRLQLMNNQQVHRLPENKIDLERLARSLGFRMPDAVRDFRRIYEEKISQVKEIFDRTLQEEWLREQLGENYERLPAEERVTYPALFEAIRHAEDVQVQARRNPGIPNQWTVTVISADFVGILSIIVGLFAAHRINVQSGDVFTVRFPPPEEESAPTMRLPRGRPRARLKPIVPSRKILDVFRVKTLEDVNEKFWERFREELAELMTGIVAGNLQAARERVMERVVERVKEEFTENAGPTRLFPVRTEIDNESSPAWTQLQIHAPDTLGFLFEFANALSLLGVRIERVEIRTVGGEVRDTFWVTNLAGDRILDPARLHELRTAAVLIKQFTHLLPRSPNPAQALRQFTALAREMLARPDWTGELQSLESGAVLRTLADLMGVSEFLWEDFLRLQHENLYPVLRDVPALDRAHSIEELAAQLAEEIAPAERDPAERLNRFKDREMFRIDLRHITRRIEFQEFSRELSDLTEVVVASAAEIAFRQVRERFGAPLTGEGEPCSWCVCALGKFGGREMGFASDVELIFVYEAEGETGGEEPVPNSEIFQEWVRVFLKTLTSRREGIFEIDLTLRPFGKGGGLACSLDTFRRYFSRDGDARQFERLALVKLRPVAADASLSGKTLSGASLSERLMGLRDAFVYSGRALDYGDVLHLRRRQAKELVSPGQVNAKFSPGGLVDVEYFVQTCQIEAGVENASLRTPNTGEAIERLREAGRLEEAQAAELRKTYGFLRRLIDALRVVRGHARDLTLPPADSREFAYLARRLQYDSPAKLAAEIVELREFARNLWPEKGDR